MTEESDKCPGVGTKEQCFDCVREELFRQNRETLPKEAKRRRNLSSSMLAGKKRKRLTCSAEEGVYCQLNDCGLSFDLKRTLFEDY